MLTATQGQIPEGVGSVARPVVQRAVMEYLPFLVVFFAVIAQGFRTGTTFDLVEPATRQDGAHGIDAVGHALLGDDEHGADVQPGKHFLPALPVPSSRARASCGR